MYIWNCNTTIQYGFELRIKGFSKIKSVLHIFKSHRGSCPQNVNLSFYVRDGWMEINERIKLCQKCPLHTILLTPF
jgi:hypothetical protein